MVSAMDQTGIKGVSNPLSLVNPQDIESFKRFEGCFCYCNLWFSWFNGVIIITTKKGRRGLQVVL